MTAPQVEFDKIDQDISKLESILDHLRLKRKALQKNKPQHEKITTPVFRLPGEINAPVFHLCLSEWNVGEFGSFDAMNAPLLLGQICARWQAITLSERSI